MANVSKISDGTTTYDISSVTVKNQNSLGNSLKMWTGTKAQYDAIVTKDNNTLYNITDDANGSQNIYNKAEIDTLLLNKADINLNNISQDYDYVIDSKEMTAGDPTWYRLYKSGWVEQGGYVEIYYTGGGNPVAWNANFPITMYNTLYQILTSFKSGWIYDSMGGAEDFSTTYISGFFKANSNNNQNVRIYWEVKGKSA